jgi:hypothetical protein
MRQRQVPSRFSDDYCHAGPLSRHAEDVPSDKWRSGTTTIGMPTAVGSCAMAIGLGRLIWPASVAEGEHARAFPA